MAVNEATIKFEIWDTGGQERYPSLVPMYYRRAIAAIVVYDRLQKRVQFEENRQANQRRVCNQPF